MRPVPRKSLFGLIFSLSLLVGLAWQLPATLMDSVVSSQTAGELRLAHASGGFWSGRGVFVTRQGMRLTETISWRLGFEPWRLAMAVELQGSGLAWGVAGSKLRLGLRGIELPAGRLAMPRLDLSSLPGALGLARLSGAPTLSWPASEISGGQWRGLAAGGVARLRVVDLSSGLSPIRPLGQFDLSVALETEGPIAWRLESSPESVLDLQATGPWSIPLKIDGSLACRRFCDYMAGLMAIIGKPEGERYVLRYGS